MPSRDHTDIFPHAAYATFTHMVCVVAGLTLCRLSPILKILCSPWSLEDDMIIHHFFAPALFGCPLYLPIERDL